MNTETLKRTILFAVLFLLPLSVNALTVSPVILSDNDTNFNIKNNEDIELNINIRQTNSQGDLINIINLSAQEVSLLPNEKINVFIEGPRTEDIYLQFDTEGNTTVSPTIKVKKTNIEFNPEIIINTGKVLLGEKVSIPIRVSNPDRVYGEVIFQLISNEQIVSREIKDFSINGIYNEDFVFELDSELIPKEYRLEVLVTTEQGSFYTGKGILILSPLAIILIITSIMILFLLLAYLGKRLSYK